MAPRQRATRNREGHTSLAAHRSQRATRDRPRRAVHDTERRRSLGIAADEEKQHEYVVKFTEQMLSFRGTRSANDAEHARPVSLVTPVLEASSGTRRKGAEQSLVGAVTLGGSETMPILGIVGRAPAGTSWMQFVVDSTGHVEPGSISLPADTSAKRLASVKSMLPRVHFAPARDTGKPVCELLRMQVNFTPR